MKKLVFTALTALTVASSPHMHVHAAEAKTVPQQQNALSYGACIRTIEMADAETIRKIVQLAVGNKALSSNDLAGTPTTNAQKNFQLILKELCRWIKTDPRIRDLAIKQYLEFFPKVTDRESSPPHPLGELASNVFDNNDNFHIDAAKREAIIRLNAYPADQHQSIVDLILAYFDNLKVLVIAGCACPNLVIISKSLEDVSMYNGILEGTTILAPNLSKLTLQNCQNLQAIDPFPTARLHELTAKDCPQLRDLTNLSGSNLARVDLTNCGLRSLAGLSFPSLKSLFLPNCKNLEAVDNFSAPNLNELIATNCPRLRQIAGHFLLLNALNITGSGRVGDMPIFMKELTTLNLRSFTSEDGAEDLIDERNNRWERRHPHVAKIIKKGSRAFRDVWTITQECSNFLLQACAIPAMMTAVLFAVPLEFGIRKLMGEKWSQENDSSLGTYCMAGGSIATGLILAALLTHYSKKPGLIKAALS